MPEKSNQPQEKSDARWTWMVQRAVVLQVLRDDHPERWPRAELERKIPDAQPAEVGDAIERLEQVRVVEVQGETVWATRCARHLDALELISI
jgi:hypothetical protein